MNPKTNEPIATQPKEPPQPKVTAAKQPKVTNKGKQSIDNSNVEVPKVEDVRRLRVRKNVQVSNVGIGSTTSFSCKVYLLHLFDLYFTCGQDQCSDTSM